MTTPQLDVHAYYRQVTDVDIGEIAHELMGGRITQESGQNLFCDCPVHRSQSHRSLHVMLDKQGWYCFGCGVGGDVLQLVEFVRHGSVTRGQSGRMPESHREARDFLAGRVGLPPLSKAISGNADEAEQSHAVTLRVRGALTALANYYHHQLLGNAEVLTWFRSKYGIGDETIARLKVGFAVDGETSAARTLAEGPQAFTLRELAATSAFHPTAQDGVIPFFERRIVFPYWGRGHVVFMIGRRTPWTPDQGWEKAKYKKLAVRNERDRSHVAPCIRNDVLYNEDVLLTHPERVIITEGVTDCISLMEHGFPVVSPVTVQIREADWERLLPKLAGVKTVFVCQDNEVSEAGLHGAMRTAGILAGSGILTRVATLPLGERQQAARRQLREKSGVGPGVTRKELATLLGGQAEAEVVDAESLLAAAKIDVNEFFASGKSAADFEALLASAQTPLELAIAGLSAETSDAVLGKLLDPILAEIKQLDPLDQNRYLKLVQARIGSKRVPVTTLRKQMKVVDIGQGRNRRPGGPGRGRHRASAAGASAGNGFPAIQVNNRQLRDITADAWLAVGQMNGDLTDADRQHFFLFQRQGTLVRLTGSGSDDGLEIEMAQDASIFALLVQVANWMKSTEEAVFDAHPPRDLARIMMAHPHKSLPWLEGVLRTPAFGRSGQLISQPGYHESERVWLQPYGNLELPPIPDSPSANDIAAARSLLFDELLGDFPFVSHSDAAHAIAAMILPFVRRLFRGPTPIHLIEAPRPGSGKGLLSNVISVIVQGTPCETKTLPGDEEEVRKTLTTELLKGHPLVLLDNADERKPIQSGALASVTTAEIWGNRQLGKLDSIRVPNLALWLLTANNPKLVGEMARRCIRIRIDAKVDRPWRRASFRHPHLLDWARANRTQLVHAVLVLGQAWLVAGRPPHKVRLGSYEAWSTTVGGILEVAGIAGFLGSLDELYDDADVEGQDWRAFVTAWWAAYQSTPQLVAELNRFCEREALMLGARGDRSERSQQIRLGNALNSHRDQVFENLRIVSVKPPRQQRGTAMYALENVEGCDPQTGPDDPGDQSDCRDVGRCRDVCRDVEIKQPDTLSPIEPIAYSGVSGTSGCLAGSLRIEIEENAHSTKTEEERNIHIEGAPESALNIPTFPTGPTTVFESTTWVSGCGAPNIPTHIPTHPDIPTLDPSPGIDLADLVEDR